MGATDPPYCLAYKRPSSCMAQLTHMPIFGHSPRLLLVLAFAAPLLAAALLLPPQGIGLAQTVVPEPGVQVPGFWDPRRRPERPDLSRVSVIRFMTETDYPPFN